METEQGLYIVFELSLLAHWEEEAVYNKYDSNRKAQIYDPQGDCSGFVHRHRGQSQGVTGGKYGMIPGSWDGAVHERDHDQGKEELPWNAWQERINKKFKAASDPRSDRARRHAVITVFIAGLEKQKCIQRDPIRMCHRKYVADRTA